MKNKLISLCLLGICLLGNVSVAMAWDGTTTVNQMYGTEKTAYADSSQWKQNENGYWMCTPDFHQPYVSTWVCTNGKWYYINSYGIMVHNTWVNNYYVDSTGAWVKTR